MDQSYHAIKPLRDNIGLKYIGEIKQHLFLFESIGVTSLDHIKNTLLSYDKSAFDELENLHNRDLIFNTVVHTTFDYNSGKVTPRNTVLLDAKKLLSHGGEIYPRILHYANNAPDKDKGYDAGALATSLIWNSRADGVAKGNSIYFPLIGSNKIPGITTNKHVAFHITFEKIPIPHPETPFENILDFKANPDNKLRISSLRNLLNELGSSNLNETEIKERIEYLLEAYEQALRKNKTKFYYGVLETVLATVINPKLGLLKGVLSIVKGEISFSANEIGLKGFEVSYLYKAKKFF